MTSGLIKYSEHLQTHHNASAVFAEAVFGRGKNGQSAHAARFVAKTINRPDSTLLISRRYPSDCYCSGRRNGPSRSFLRLSAAMIIGRAGVIAGERTRTRGAQRPRGWANGNKTHLSAHRDRITKRAFTVAEFIVVPA